MNLLPLLLIPVYIVHILAAPLLFAGLVRKGKALLQGRQGPSVLQPFWDVAKLLQKGQTVSATTTQIFRGAALLNLSCIIAAALMAPWVGLPAPLSGDLVLLIYVLALSKFSAGLGALDSGSSFGAFAASREVTLSLQTEPAMLLGLAALAVHAHTTSLNGILLASNPTGGPRFGVIALLVVVALWISGMAELSRMPVDDPTTHLELTMVHEALILENSGPNLAVAEYAAALKAVILFGLVAQVALLLAPPGPLLLRYAFTLLLLLGAAGVVIVGETVMVKLRWRRLPNLLSFALTASVLAALLAVVR